MGSGTLKKLLAPATTSTAAWYAKVPLLTNGFMAVDFLTAICAVFAGAFCLVLAVQFVTGGGVGPQQVQAALHVALYVSAGLAAALVFVCLCWLKNRYIAYYEVTEAAVTGELMADSGRGALRDFVLLRAESCPAPGQTGRVKRKALAMREILRVREFPAQCVLHVKGRGMALSVYCLTPQRYDAVLVLLKQHAAI